MPKEIKSLKNILEKRGSWLLRAAVLLSPISLIFVAMISLGTLVGGLLSKILSSIISIICFWVFFIIFYNIRDILLAEDLEKLSKLSIKDTGKSREKVLDVLNSASYHLILPLRGLKRSYYKQLNDTIKVRLEEIIKFGEAETYEKIKEDIENLADNARNREYYKIKKNSLEIWNKSERELNKYKSKKENMRMRHNWFISLLQTILISISVVGTIILPWII